MATSLEQWIYRLVLCCTIVMAAGSARAAHTDTSRDCACLCVNGVATTLCSSVAAAQAGPQLCRAAPECPQPAGGRALALATPLAAPATGARACRTVQLWDRRMEAYGPGRICDVEQQQP